MQGNRKWGGWVILAVITHTHVPIRSPDITATTVIPAPGSRCGAAYSVRGTWVQDAARIGSVQVPNPTKPENIANCHIQKPAFVCDQDGVLGDYGVLQVVCHV